MNNSQLSVGVLSLENGAIQPMKCEGVKSALLGSDESLSCDSDMCNNTLEQVVQNKEALVILDAEDFDKVQNSGLS